jgi:4-amino-4-deoxy-L-arabinose transferase-like glycosyltransferase
MLLAILFLPFALFFPGHVTRAWLRPESKASEQEKGLPLLFESLLFSVLLTGWLGLVLAEIGFFNLRLLLVILVVYSLAVGGLARRSGGKLLPRIQRPSTWDGMLLLIVLLSGVLFFRPHEHLVGAADVGVYANIGANVARTGSLIIDDHTLGQLDSTVYPALLREQPAHLVTRWLRFAGFYLDDATAGRVIPQFFALHPVWLAVFYALFGVWGALMATPLWGLLGCISVYFSASRMFGQRTGWLAALLLTLSSTQIWFARYSTAEPLTQFLIFGGLYALVRLLENRRLSPWWGTLAGLAWGQVFLTRIDTLPLLLPVGVYGLFWLRRRPRTSRGAVFFVTLSTMLIHAILHAVAFSWPYTHNTFQGRNAKLAIALVLSTVGGTLFVVLGRRLCPPTWQQGIRRTLLRVSFSSEQRIRIVFSAGLILLAAYAYFLRPRLGHVREAYYWYVESQIYRYDHENMVRLGWYLSPLGIWLGVAGAALLIWHGKLKRSGIFLAIGLLFSLQYLYSTFSNPHHVYTMRRYVPVVLPAFVIWGAYALAQLASFRKWGWWLALGLTGAWIGVMLYLGRGLIRQTDNRGAVEQFRVLNSALEPRSVLFLGGYTAGSQGDVIGTPLQYLYGHDVFVLRDPELLSHPLMVPTMSQWLDEGRAIYFLTNGRDPMTLPPGWSAEPGVDFRFSLAALEHTYDRFPTQIITHRRAVSVYRLRNEPLAQGTGEAYPLTVDIGGLDDLYVGGGFYSKEWLSDDLSVRWTGRRAELHLPAPGDAQETKVSLRLAWSRGATLELDPLSLYANGQLIGTITPSRDLAIHELTAHVLVQSADTDELVLALEADTWNPEALGISPDGRDLGVLLDWVKIDIRP